MKGKLKEKLTVGALRLFGQRLQCSEVKDHGAYGIQLWWRQAGRHMWLNYNAEKDELTWSVDHQHAMRDIFQRLFTPDVARAIMSERRTYNASTKDLRLSKEMKACLLVDNLVAQGAAPDTIKIDSLPDGRFTVEQLLGGTEQVAEVLRG